MKTTIKHIINWKKFTKLIKDNGSTLGGFAKQAGVSKQSIHQHKNRFAEGKRNSMLLETTHKYLMGLYKMGIYRSDGKAYEFADLFKTVKIEYDVEIVRKAKKKEIVM